MKRRTAADVRTSLDMHMAREHDFVRNRDFIFELAIVRNMHADHEEIAIADGSGTTAVGSTTVHRHVFTNVIAVTELKPGWFAAVLSILRRSTDRGEREELIPFTEACVTFDDDMRSKHAVLAERHVWSNHAPWTDLHRRGELGSGIDDGSGMNACHGVRWRLLNIRIDHHKPEFRFRCNLVADLRAALQMPCACGCANIFCFKDDLITRHDRLAQLHAVDRE